MILKTLAESARMRVESAKQIVPYDVLKDRVKGSVNSREAFAFEKALKSSGISFICELKKASPTKGEIAPVFPYKEIAMEYEEAGAHAISVLTEPEYFKGRDQFLKVISELVSTPT